MVGSFVSLSVGQSNFQNMKKGCPLWTARFALVLSNQPFFLMLTGAHFISRHIIPPIMHIIAIIKKKAAEFIGQPQKKISLVYTARGDLSRNSFSELPNHHHASSSNFLRTSRRGSMSSRSCSQGPVLRLFPHTGHKP